MDARSGRAAGDLHRPPRGDLSRVSAPLRLALCNEVIAEGRSLSAQAAFAAALGYDGLEIAPFTLDARAPHLLSARAVTRMRAEVEAEGIVVSGLHWLMLAPEGLSVTDPDPEVARRTGAVIEGLVELCAGLGGGYLIHGSPAQRALAPGRAAEGRARASAHLARAGDLAAAAGVTWCLEPLSPDQTGLITTLAEAEVLLAPIARPGLSAMIDCASAGAFEDAPIPELLRRHLPSGLISHVHLNDPNRRGPGEGDLDFAPILGALRTLGYDGWVGVEPFRYIPDGPACAARAAGYLRGMEAALRSGAAP